MWFLTFHSTSTAPSMSQWCLLCALIISYFLSLFHTVVEQFPVQKRNICKLLEGIGLALSLLGFALWL